MNRFGHSGFREDCELLVEIIKGLGEEGNKSIGGRSAIRTRHRSRGSDCAS